MGDFSYKEIDYNRCQVQASNNSEAHKFFMTTQDLFLIQHVRQPTRIREGTQELVLDYIFTNEEMLIENVRYDAPLGKSAIVWDYISEAEGQDSKLPKLNYW